MYSARGCTAKIITGIEYTSAPALSYGPLANQTGIDVKLRHVDFAFIPLEGVLDERTSFRNGCKMGDYLPVCRFYKNN